MSDTKKSDLQTEDKSARIEYRIQTTNFKTPQMKAMFEILVTANAITSRHNSFLKPYNLSTQQYNILRMLRGSFPSALTIHDINDRMIDRSPNTTRMIDKLLPRDLVTRYRSDSDRRVVYVEITEKGLNLLVEIDKELGTFKKFLDNINVEEAEQLSVILTKLRSANIGDF
ncbi:MarR family winged helix-turn-helix transcriptional regulator [Sediminitomix flava]|nr:MarR family transcriptional regulator [Sediminitomix flava]